MSPLAWAVLGITITTAGSYLLVRGVFWLARRYHTWRQSR